MKKNKFLLFNFSIAIFFFCSNTYALTEDEITITDFLDLLKDVCSSFLEWFLKFCNVFIDNWFVLVLVGFGLFVSVIWIAFDIMDFSIDGFGFAKDSVDDYLDKKADRDLAIRNQAEKELIMRQNRTQVFDPVTNSIVNVPDSNLVQNLKYRNLKNYNYGNIDSFSLKRSNIPDLPYWFGKDIKSNPTSSQEKKELDDILKEMQS